MDSSNPSTSSSNNTTPSLKCQVCFQAAHGNHFGVESCRACAAFFRRVFVTHKQHFKCRVGDQKCTPDIYGRWNCKRCRTDRCFALGMKPDNIQHNRDLFFCSENFSKRNKPMFSLPPTVTDEFISYVDLSPLIETSTRMLQHSPRLETRHESLSSLRKLALGLKEMRKAQLWDDIKEIDVIGRTESINYMRTEVGRSAQWLMYFDEFRNLELEDRLLITKCMWILFTRVERSAMTAEMRRQNKLRDNEFSFKTDVKVNLDTVQWNYDWLSPFSTEQMQAFLGTPSVVFYGKLVDCMLEIRPTDEELCYLVCTLCFHHLGSRLGGRIQEMTERLQAVLADDLHKYYLETDKTSRYLHRLNKVLKINQQYKTLTVERRRSVFLGTVFGAFKVQWSHQDWFSDAS
ncbi:unnamed protein product [Caenorhabditis sp. 36 PRJEB53466]|nr:unnamed protein product [Caenorhabditis sp. 36 PRJEB53466]